jgi:hypothetical protein
MTQQEALIFIERKDRELQESVNNLTVRANHIKENIQFLLTYINSLQQVK